MLKNKASKEFRDVFSQQSQQKPTVKKADFKTISEYGFFLVMEWPQEYSQIHKYFQRIKLTEILLAWADKYKAIPHKEVCRLAHFYKHKIGWENYSASNMLLVHDKRRISQKVESRTMENYSQALSSNRRNYNICLSRFCANMGQWLHASLFSSTE